MLLPGPESVMGPCTASHCCCLHRHTLPCATFRVSSHTAGVCPESLMGPCTASHCCCLHRHTLPCATFRSPHTLLVCEFFDIGCWQITGLP
ncbi:unnamed protein product [Staurois parvus]|uniref:Secreted protein n=1 Tax=Staurois parvus TaxID=386267 RepID=A0ABN9E3Z4_9NEOB|nr:unnamed protein product [Staurois parvus]